MWNAAIAMLRGKCIALKAYNRKGKLSNNLRKFSTSKESQKNRKIKLKKGIIKIT